MIEPVDVLCGLAVVDIIDFEHTASVIQTKQLIEVFSLGLNVNRIFQGQTYVN